MSETTFSSSMWIAVRWLRLGLVMFWTAALLMAGVWLVRAPAEALTLIGPLAFGGDLRVTDAAFFAAVAAISGSQFLFAFLVADDLCPQAPMVLRGFFELFTAVLALGALARCVWLVWGFLSGVS